MSKRASNYLLKCDPLLAPIIKSVGVSKLKGRVAEEPFSALARAIAYQQLAGQAAQTIWARVLELFGGALAAPEVVAPTDLRKLRGCGLSRAKSRALKDLARKTVSGIIPSRRQTEKLSDDEILARCTAVKGIGPWTVEMFLMFSLGRPDVFPASDYGVRTGFALLHKRSTLPSPRELLQYSGRWKPYRSHAAWYLWRVVDLQRK